MSIPQDHSLFESISVDRELNTPVFQQVSSGLLKLIRTGELSVGTKLPATRQMAFFFNLHRKTVQMALDELSAQGWLEIVPRRGTFVSGKLPEFIPNKKIPYRLADKYPPKTNYELGDTILKNFTRSNFQSSGKLIVAEGFPDVRLTPMQLFLREFRSVGKRGSFNKYFQYGDPQGTLYLREVLSEFLNETRAMPIRPENILITRGAQMGLYVAARTLINPGDEVVVADPGFVIATLTLQSVGGVINKIHADDEGLNIDLLEQLCQKKKIRLVYTIPHHHQPTTATLSPERRIRLLELADKYNFAIIEDDYDYDFHYQSNPVVPLASLDHSGNVIYLGTLTKTLAPSIRIGFLVAPKNFIEEAVAIRRSIDFQGDSILEVTIAELYKSGVISSHIKKAVKTYRERRDHFCHLLNTKLGDYVSFKIPEGGLCVWTQFHDIDMKKLTKYADRNGLLMNDGTIYNTTQSFNYTRLGFSTLNIEEQEKAVDILLSGVKKQRQ